MTDTTYYQSQSTSIHTNNDNDNSETKKVDVKQTVPSMAQACKDLDDARMQTAYSKGRMHGAMIASGVLLLGTPILYVTGKWFYSFFSKST